MEKNVNRLINILHIILVILIIAELLFLIYTYRKAKSNGDTVECNWVWCTITTKTTIKTSSNYTQCFINGEPINCSNISEAIP